MAVLEPYPVLSNSLGEPVRVVASPRRRTDVRLLLEVLNRKASHGQFAELEFHFVAFSVQQHSKKELLRNLKRSGFGRCAMGRSTTNLLAGNGSQETEPALVYIGMGLRNVRLTCQHAA